MALLSELWINDPIAALIRAHFPELNEQTPEGTAFKRLSLTDQQTKRDEADAFFQKAQNFSETELQVAIADGKKLVEMRYQKFRAAELAKPFYHRITAEMDLDHWSRVAYWTIDEAAALSFGKDPRQVTRDKLRESRQPSRFSAEYEARFEILERARFVRQLSQHTRVMHFIEWAERTRFPMPENLLEAAKAIHGPEINGMTKTHKDTEAIQTEAINVAGVKPVSEEAAAAEIAKSKGTSLGARERDSLLKLVIGMAISGYSYDPNATRSDKIKEIADDLERLGIPLDADTVRKYIQEARDLLPAPEAEQKR